MFLIKNQHVKRAMLTVNTVALTLTALIAMSSCGLDAVALKEQMQQEKAKKQSGDATPDGANDGETGTVAFDLSSIALPADEKGQVQDKDILAADRLTLNYWGHCYNDVGVGEVETPPPAPSSLPPSTPVANSSQLSYEAPVSTPDCTSGQLTVDLRKDKQVKINRLAPGRYTFVAIAYRSDREIKRGKTHLEVIAGEIAHGAIVLHKSPGAGNVIIDIVDGSRSVCVEYRKLLYTPQPALCQLGRFECSYSPVSKNSQKPDAKILREESICSDFDARVKILKQLCEGGYDYEKKIECKHSDK